MMMTTPTSARVSRKYWVLNISIAGFWNVPVLDRQRALRTYQFRLCGNKWK
jgi:hypothetical protein